MSPESTFNGYRSWLRRRDPKHNPGFGDNTLSQTLAQLLSHNGLKSLGGSTILHIHTCTIRHLHKGLVCRRQRKLEGGTCCVQVCNHLFFKACSSSKVAVVESHFPWRAQGVLFAAAATTNSQLAGLQPLQNAKSLNGLTRSLQKLHYLSMNRFPLFDLLLLHLSLAWEGLLLLLLL